MPTDTDFEGLVAHLKKRSKRQRNLSVLLFLIPLLLAAGAGLLARKQTHADRALKDRAAQSDTLVSLYDSILRVYVEQDTTTRPAQPETTRVPAAVPSHPKPSSVAQPETTSESRVPAARVALDSTRKAVKADQLPHAIRYLREVRSSLAPRDVPAERKPTR
jgi:hypothetical protein